MFFQTDLLSKPFESSRTDHYAADVVAHEELVGIAAGISVLHSLQAEDVERRRFAGNKLSRSLAAGGKAIALVERPRNHDSLWAVHQVHRGRILVRNSDAQFQSGQALFLRLLVVSADDRDHLLGENASTRDSQPGFSFALKESKNHGVAFDENGRGSVLGQELIDRLVKIEAKVGSRVQPALEERAGERGGFANVCFENYMAKHLLFARFLFIGKQELVERVVDG